MIIINTPNAIRIIGLGEYQCKETTFTLISLNLYMNKAQNMSVNVLRSPCQGDQRGLSMFDA